MNKQIRHAFLCHRSKAKARGIEFKLSYEEWLDIWEKSGKLSLRGKGKGKYVMARFGDKGAYEIGNVIIKSQEENAKEAHCGKKRLEETKIKISLKHKGRICTWGDKISMTKRKYNEQ